MFSICSFSMIYMFAPARKLIINGLAINSFIDSFYLRDTARPINCTTFSSSLSSKTTGFGASINVMGQICVLSCATV